MSGVYRYGEDGATYHYAPFEGEALLHAFAESRASLVARCLGAKMQLRGDIADAALDADRRAFEVRGRLADGAEDAQSLARVWWALSKRAAARGDVRDLNGALKLGDRVTRVGVAGLDDTARAWVYGAVGFEREAIGVLGERRRLKSPSRAESRISIGAPGALRGFGMLLVNSSRSRAYLDVLVANGMLPAHVVLVSRGADDDASSGEHVEQFDNVTPIASRLRELNLPVTRIETNDINEVRVARAVSGAGLDVMIYSGPPGVKVAPSLLRAGAEFVHVHGGRLPDQRGSTTSYYSLLAENRCWASAIVMNAKLDRGAVIAQRAYDPPLDRAQMDHGFDPWMRADLLCRVMKRYVQRGSLSRLPQPALGTMHYVMHPVLRHLAILSGVQARVPQRQMREAAFAS